MKLFGFELARAKDETPLPSFVAPVNDDGAVEVLTTGFGSFGTYVDLDGTIRTEAELINKYRVMSEHPEVDRAIDNIVNETIVATEDNVIVEPILDDCPIEPKIKKIIIEEFKQALIMLEFNTHAYEVFKRWYVDGRLYYAVVIDPQDPQAGIQELRYIDPRKIRKIKETKKKKDARTNINLPEIAKEYYLFNEKGFYNSLQIAGAQPPTNSGTQGVKIAKDTVILVTSGLSSTKGDMILSYLHKAIRPLNNLRSLEDSLIIYRMSRAPERLIFYIDVGNLPKMKAEQYLKDVMTKFKNKIVYDSATGEVRDDRKFMTMLENFWLPRREGGRGTEITTLPGGQNLSQIDDIIYFQKNLYKSLNVPISRLDPETMFTQGRVGEITRDEVLFSKFIGRLRSKFAEIFIKILERQLVLKGVMSPDEFAQLVATTIRFDFKNDNYFEELKEHSVMAERLNILTAIDPYVGKYYSSTWVRKNVLNQTDEDIEEMEEEIANDIKTGMAVLPAEAQMQGQT